MVVLGWDDVTVIVEVVWVEVVEEEEEVVVVVVVGELREILGSILAVEVLVMEQGQGLGQE